MMDMQSMVDKMRSEPADEKAELSDLWAKIEAALDAGQITVSDVKDMLSGSEIMDEMSATGGGSASGGASFTPGSGMAYAQALDKPKKKVKEGLTTKTPGVDVTSRWKTEKPKAITGDGKTVGVGDHVYYKGFPVVIKNVYEKAGKTYLKAFSEEENVSIEDISTRFKSQEPEMKETKDKEPKLAAGKLKKNYAVDKFGFTPAPSIPNRPSTGGFQYKDLWGESQDLQESYSRFKKAARERDGAGQFNTGIGIVRKKLAEVNRMMEYLAQLKGDLSTAGQLKETKHTQRALEKVTEAIKTIYAKHKKLK